jgi:hypothetical protein
MLVPTRCVLISVSASVTEKTETYRNGLHPHLIDRRLHNVPINVPIVGDRVSRPVPAILADLPLRLV